MRGYEWMLVFVGGVVLIALGFFMAGKFQDALASPSGAAYGWAIGVFVALLVGIASISAAFSWLRNRDAGQGKQEQSPASVSTQTTPSISPEKTH